MWFLPSALNVKVKKFKQARVNGGSNYDSLKMEALVTSTMMKQGITLLNSLDPTIHALLKETKLEQRLLSLAKAMRLSWPILHTTEH